MTEGLLLKVLSGAGGSSGGSDIDVTDFASQDDITSLWTALGNVCDTIEALVDKLTGASTPATLESDFTTEGDDSFYVGDAEGGEEETGTEIEYMREE